MFGAAAARAAPPPPVEVYERPEPVYIEETPPAPECYVERRPDERDRRVKLLALTDEGMRVRDEIRARLSVPPEALTRLSKGDQRVLRDLLRKALET